MRRCFRCGGQKKLFKTGSAYSKTDTGGVEIDCPMCNGKGQIKSIEDVKVVVKKKAIKLKGNKGNEVGASGL